MSDLLLVLADADSRLGASLVDLLGTLIFCSSNYSNCEGTSSYHVLLCNALQNADLQADQHV